MLVTSLNASCRTMRKSKQLHLDPGKMAVIVLSGPATRPSNCTRLWCSKKPHNTRNIFLGKLKCVALAQSTGRLALPKSLPQVQKQSNCSLLTFLRLPIKSFHFHQYFPSRLLGSSISTIRGVPLKWILLLPLHPFWCSQGFPPTYQRWHEAQSVSLS